MLASLFGCGDSGGPTTTATPSPTPIAAPNVPPPATGFIARVTNAVTGAPVAGARIEIEGVGNLTTDTAGNVTIDLTQSPSTPSGRKITVDAGGFLARQSRVSSTPTSSFVDVSLFPSGDPFDLNFFDHVFRDTGERGTRPWKTEPLFEIWTTVFDCVEMTEEGVCDELEATDEAAPTAFIRNARMVVEDHSRRYTGGAILGNRITERRHEAGVRIVHEDQSERGKVTIAMVMFPHRTSWARTWFFTESQAKSRAHIQMNRHHRDNIGIYSHELAHALGFRHPLGRENVPLPSIMRQGHGDEPTRHDVLHGRLAYMRPAGSMTPDTDPASFILNELRESMIGGSEIEVVDP